MGDAALTAKSIKALQFFWMLDFNKRPRRRRGSRRLHRRLFPVPPSMVVESGGGLHPYWILKQPFYLRAPKEMAEAQAAGF